MSEFLSRRSPVVTLHGAVASSQPLATRIGADILQRGGNAADAAISVAAALNVTEPCSTGIGGDAFCLFYNARSKDVRGINGSGRAPSRLTLDLLKSQGFTDSHYHPLKSALNVTVPGAAAAWVDTVEQFGGKKLTMAELLQPAIDLAEQGFPVHTVAAEMWRMDSACLTATANKHGKDMLLDGRSPRTGDVMKMPYLAKTFKELGSLGKDGFYTGRIAQAIVDVVHQHGGVISMEDLENHHSTFDKPISTCYRGINVWEMPPNGQGLTALMALNILEGFDIQGLEHNSSQYLHLLIEAIRLSFADACWYIADPSTTQVPLQELLSKPYASKRRLLIQPDKAMDSSCLRGTASTGSDTVYFTVLDGEGNACSFINSNYMHFGTGLVPQGCGFTLQNRGANFSLQPGHPNVLEPGKRPYHTIIPGMATDSTGELYASFGVMGGFMQPQGHVQVLANMIDFNMDPQQALDAARFSIETSGKVPCSVMVEQGIAETTIAELRSLGHHIVGPVTGHERSLFGRGQIIARRLGRQPGGSETPVYWAGSDPRADGMALGL